MKVIKSKNIENRLISLFDIDNKNKIVSEMFLTYLDNADFVSQFVNNNHSLYDCIIKNLKIDQDTLFELRDYKLNNNVIKLDINDYLNNPYYQNIHLDNIKGNHIYYENKSFKANEGFLCFPIEIDNDFHESIKIGYFEKPFDYLTVCYDNSIWMLITPHEINTMQKAIDKASGNVITFGLGLGYFAYMCSVKENVKSVTIIEKDQEIIDLFTKYILPQFNFKEKIIIINDDALNYLNQNNLNYDYGFVDLWHDVDDGLELYIKMYQLAKKHPHIRFDYWIEESMIIMLRRCLISLIYEELYESNDFDEYENYYDEIINKLHVLLKEYKINNPLDIDNLISEKFIKDLILKL